MVRRYGGAGSEWRRSIVAWTALAVLVAACAGPVATPPGSPDPAHTVPVPVGASEVGSGNRAADGGQPVIGFESPLAPGDALASYRATLAASGFTEVGADGAWRTFSDGQRVLAVRVASSGPPTSIVVRVVTDAVPVVARPPDPAARGPATSSDPAAVGSPAARTAPPSGGSGDGTDVVAATPTPTPTPRPTRSPAPTPVAAPTEGPPGQGGTPPGQGGTPPGQGGTPPSAVPTPEPPTPSPSAEPSDTPHPTPKPHPTPDPSPKPTKSPKPDPSPTADPTPKPPKDPKP